MAKQQMIPGTEGAKIKEIEDAAEEYVKIRDKRMKLTEQEITAKTNLLNVVKAHKGELSVNGNGEVIYRYDGDMLVILKQGKENVKVKHDTGLEDDEDDDE